MGVAVRGSILVSPGFVTATGETVFSFVLTGSVVISPSAVSAVGQTLIAQAIKGSVALVPDPAEAVGVTAGEIVMLLALVYAKFKGMYRGHWKGMR
jgi:hypothetical protein